MADNPWSRLDDIHVLLVAARSHYEEGSEASGGECLDRAIGIVEEMARD